jgi:hypothetical protein
MRSRSGAQVAVADNPTLILEAKMRIARVLLELCKERERIIREIHGLEHLAKRRHLKLVKVVGVKRLHARPKK